MYRRNGQKNVRWGRLSLIAAVVLVAAASASSSASADAICAGTQVDRFSPAVTNTAKSTSVTVNGNLAVCRSLQDSRIRSATFSPSFTDNVSCTTLLLNSSGSFDVRWNTGRTSTVTVNNSVSYAAGNITITRLGSVTAGQFRGATVTGQTVEAADLTQCSGAGIATVFGPATLVIL